MFVVHKAINVVLILKDKLPIVSQRLEAVVLEAVDVMRDTNVVDMDVFQLEVCVVATLLHLE